MFQDVEDVFNIFGLFFEFRGKRILHKKTSEHFDTHLISSIQGKLEDIVFHLYFKIIVNLTLVCMSILHS